MIPLLLAIPFGPLLAWKRGDLLAATQRLYAAFGVALLAALAVFWAWGMKQVLAPIGVGLAGEGAITLIRAARRGIEMPWKELGNQVHDRLQNRS